MASRETHAPKLSSFTLGGGALALARVLVAAIGVSCSASSAPANTSAYAAVPTSSADDVTPPPASASAASSAAAGASALASASAAPPAASVAPPSPDVVYWPTPAVVVDRMLALAEVKKTDVIYDLGCGDARSLVTAAKRYGARGYGFDIDPRRVEEARQNARDNGVEELVTIEQTDIFTLDLSPANVVFLYLLTKLNDRLVPQLEQLRPGSRVVSHEFDMPRVKPAKVVHVLGPPDGPPETDPTGPLTKHTLYLWKMPWQRRPAPAEPAE